MFAVSWGRNFPRPPDLLGRQRPTHPLTVDNCYALQSLPEKHSNVKVAVGSSHLGAKLVLIKISRYAEWSPVHNPHILFKMHICFGWVAILLLSCCHFLGDQHYSLEFAKEAIFLGEFPGAGVGWHYFSCVAQFRFRYRYGFSFTVVWSLWNYIVRRTAANSRSLPGPVKSVISDPKIAFSNIRNHCQASHAQFV